MEESQQCCELFFVKSFQCYCFRKLPVVSERKTMLHPGSNLTLPLTSDLCLSLNVSPFLPVNPRKAVSLPLGKTVPESIG